MSGAAPTVDIQNTVQQKAFTREVHRRAADRLEVVGRAGGARARREADRRAERRRHRIVERHRDDPRRPRRRSHHAARRHALQPGQRVRRRSQRLQRERRQRRGDHLPDRRALPPRSRPAASSATSFRKKAATGSAFFFGAAYTNNNLQSDNLDDDSGAPRHPHRQFRRQDLGLSTRRSAVRSGQNKLWFYTAFRGWGVDQGIAGTFFNQTPTRPVLRARPGAARAQHLGEGQPEPPADLDGDAEEQDQRLLRVSAERRAVELRSGRARVRRRDLARGAAVLRSGAALLRPVALDQHR